MRVNHALLLHAVCFLSFIVSSEGALPSSVQRQLGRQIKGVKSIRRRLQKEDGKGVGKNKGNDDSDSDGETYEENHGEAHELGPNCEVVEFFLRPDSVAAENVLSEGERFGDDPRVLQPGGKLYVNFPLYADEDAEELIGYAQSTIHFTPGGGFLPASCTGRSIYGFNPDQDGIFQHGFSIVGNCFSESSIVTGGYGQYSCASGIESSTAVNAELDLIKLTVCYACSEGDFHY